MQKSTIAQAIEGNSELVFRPKKEFYEKTQINKKRWGLLYRGKLEAKQSELQSLSKYFGISVDAFFTKSETQPAK
jgi:hypothetical protein